MSSQPDTSTADSAVHLPVIDWCPITTEGKVTIKPERGSGSHEITVQPFEIARFPITARQFRAFKHPDTGYRNVDRRWWTWAGQTGSKHWTQPETIFADQANCPVTGVNWFNAVAFCNWLTYHSRLKGSLDDAHVIRLPTEAEWQCAAVGFDGTYDPPHRYPWGAKWDEEHLRANTSECSLHDVIAVGMFPGDNHLVSYSGAEDLFGNVAEWCLSCFNSPKETNLGDDVERAVRGAHFNVKGADHSALEWRRGHKPSTSERWLGFRVVRGLA